VLLHADPRMTCIKVLQSRKVRLALASYVSRELSLRYRCFPAGIASGCQLNRDFGFLHDGSTLFNGETYATSIHNNTLTRRKLLIFRRMKKKEKKRRNESLPRSA